MKVVNPFACFLILLWLLVSGACSVKDSLISLSEREDTAINTILNNFSGRCLYSIGVSTEIKGNHKYFEIELSQSPLIEKYADKPAIIGSGVAYLFYKGLVEEKNNYSEIRTVIVTPDNIKHTFQFPSEQLELVDQKFAVADTVINLLSQKQWDKIESRLQNSPALPISVKELVSNMNKLDDQLGLVTSKRHLGFEFGKMDEAGVVLHLYSFLRREKQGTEFRLDINTPPDDNQIYMIDYKF